MKQRLKVFDVDGTLLKSPTYRKEYWKKESPDLYFRIKDDWWTSRLSLGDPFVPCPSDADMHVESVVNLARQAELEQDVIFVVMTGRKEHLRDLVERHVLEGMGLIPDFIFLKDKGKTADYKIDTINQMIEEWEIEEVEMWDDRDPHIPKFHDFLEGHPAIKSHRVHHITEKHFTMLDFDHEKEIVERIIAEGNLKHHLKHHVK